MHDMVSGYGNGTTVNMLPADALQKPRVVVPPGRLVRAFSDLAESALARCENTIRESRRLSKLRDALLPKLLSGEIRVGDNLLTQGAMQ